MGSGCTINGFQGPVGGTGGCVEAPALPEQVPASDDNTWCAEYVGWVNDGAQSFASGVGDAMKLGWAPLPGEGRPVVRPANAAEALKQAAQQGRQDIQQAFEGTPVRQAARMAMVASGVALGAGALAYGLCWLPDHQDVPGSGDGAQGAGGSRNLEPDPPDPRKLGYIPNRPLDADITKMTNSEEANSTQAAEGAEGTAEVSKTADAAPSEEPSELDVRKALLEQIKSRVDDIRASAAERGTYTEGEIDELAFLTSTLNLLPIPLGEHAFKLAHRFAWKADPKNFPAAEQWDKLVADWKCRKALRKEISEWQEPTRRYEFYDRYGRAHLRSTEKQAAEGWAKARVREDAINASAKKKPGELTPEDVQNWIHILKNLRRQLDGPGQRDLYDAEIQRLETSQIPNLANEGSVARSVKTDERVSDLYGTKGVPLFTDDDLSLDGVIDVLPGGQPLEAILMKLRYPWGGDMRDDRLFDLLQKHSIDELVPAEAEFLLRRLGYLKNESLAATSPHSQFKYRPTDAAKLTHAIDEWVPKLERIATEPQFREELKRTQAHARELRSLVADQAAAVERNRAQMKNSEAHLEDLKRQLAETEAQLEQAKVDRPEVFRLKSVK